METPVDSKVYDKLKWVALVLLPALGGLYFALGAIWNFPAAEQVVGTVTVLDTFLGLLIAKSSKNFQATHGRPSEIVGDLVMMQDQFGTVAGMKFVGNKDPFIPTEGETVAFMVKREMSLE